MIEGIIVAFVAALLCYVCSGARTLAYLLYFIGFIPFITLDASAGGLVAEAGFGAGNVMFKMSVRLLVTAGFLALLLRRPEALNQLLKLQSAPVLFFFAWALLSLHRAQVPMISLFRLGELLVFFLGGIVLLVESARFHGPRDIARWHCLALAQILLVTLYFEQRYPELAYFVSSDGIKRLGHKFINSNTLGFACVAVAMWSTVELRECRERVRSLFMEKIVPLLALLLSMYVLLGARSRTAMITLVLGQVIVWLPLSTRQRWRVAAFGGMTCLALLLAMANADVISEWFLRGDSAASLQSGTGRTGLWGALLSEQLPRAPFLGAGYLMLGEGGVFLHGGSYWNNAHNTYLFALISTGIPGFLAVVTLVALPWLHLFRRLFTTPHEERPFWTVLFAMQTVVAIASVTGFGVAGYPNPAMFFHYSLYSYAVTRTRVTRPERALQPPVEPRERRAPHMAALARP